MNEILDSYPKIADIIWHHRDQAFLYRGVSDSCYELIPSIGRDNVRRPPSNVVEWEQSVFSDFKQKAHAYVTRLPRNDWEWLALAQHHHFVTRLLDWTRNFYVALYFACQNRERDGAVYYIDSREFGPATTGQDEVSPFEIGTDRIFMPPSLSPRITAQHALFTCHRHPTQVVGEGLHVHKWLVPQQKKLEYQWRLFQSGVSAFSLFPGLDGLAEEFNWILSVPPVSEGGE